MSWGSGFLLSGPAKPLQQGRKIEAAVEQVPHLTQAAMRVLPGAEVVVLARVIRCMAEPVRRRQLARLENRAAEQAALVAAATALEVQPILPAELTVPTAVAARAAEPIGPASGSNQLLTRLRRDVAIKELRHRQPSLVLHPVLRHEPPAVRIARSSQPGGSCRAQPPGWAEESC